MKKLERAIFACFVLTVAIASTEVRDISSCRECFELGNAMCKVTSLEQENFFCKTPLEEGIDGICSD